MQGASKRIGIAIVGCGYVSDDYLESLPNHPELKLLGVTDRDSVRAQTIAGRYGLRIYDSLKTLLADPEVEIVVNLTNPQSHFEVSKAALLSDKHVYSEKPLAMDFAEAEDLVHTAQTRGRMLSCAPCSILGETAQTLWQALLDDAVGRPQLVYAEIDDNPIYLMHPEGWRSPSGMPWPVRNEFEVGCTLEHSGYYLTWLAAFFGPARSVTSFSVCAVPDKSDLILNPPDSPDVSVACIVFHSGVVARLTCSIVAPYDHRFRIIGNEGILTTEDCWHYHAPVRHEHFSQITLNARKSRTLRTSSVLQSLFGVGGRVLPLVKPMPSWFGFLREALFTEKRSPIGAILRAAKQRELARMDFMRGVAEMAAALRQGRRCAIPADFVLHVNELALAIQKAGPSGNLHTLKTSFEPLSPQPATCATSRPLSRRKASGTDSWIDRLIGRLHQDG